MIELTSLAEIAPVVTVGVVILVGVIILMGVLVRVVLKLLAELRKNPPSRQEVKWEDCPAHDKLAEVSSAVAAQATHLDGVTKEQVEQREMIVMLKSDTNAILSHLTSGYGGGNSGGDSGNSDEGNNGKSKIVGCVMKH